MSSNSKQQTTMVAVAGAVLCGGRSRRMGQPKEWLDFGGVSLLERVVAHMAAVAQPLVVVAAPEQSLPPLPAERYGEVRLVRDPVPDQGPLLGLIAAWRALPAEAEALLAMAVDLPLVRVQVLRGLLGYLETVSEETDAVVPQVAGRWQPLLAVYRRRSLPVLERLYAAGVRRLQQVCDTLQVQAVPPDQLRRWDPELHCLCNVNTPEEYTAARHYWEQMQTAPDRCETRSAAASYTGS